jgi:ATP-binding cassette subfamily C protein CydD
MKTVKKTSNKEALRWLLERARTARSWVTLSIGLGFCNGLLLIIQARLLAHVIHSAVIMDRPWGVLWPFLVAFTGVITLRAALGWGRELAGFFAGANVRLEIRKALLEHIFKLGPALEKDAAGNLFRLYYRFSCRGLALPLGLVHICHRLSRSYPDQCPIV